jgi:hypothetical protein
MPTAATKSARPSPLTPADFAIGEHVDVTIDGWTYPGRVEGKPTDPSVKGLFLKYRGVDGKYIRKAVPMGQITRRLTVRAREGR